MIRRLHSFRAFIVSFLVLFLGFSIAVVLTARSPVTGYELSMYGETPVVFWLGTMPLLVYGTAVAVLREDRFRWIGLVGAFLVISTIVLLPLVRGYFFYGEFDSMLHLGTVRDVVAGHRDPGTIFYPALHLLAASIVFLTDISSRLALMSAALVFPFVWFIGVPLVVKELTSNRNAIVIGLLGALFLAPLNPLNIILAPHPSSQAVLFGPIVLFAFLRLTKTASPRDIACFSLGFLALYLYHPQQSLNFLLIFVVLVYVSRKRFHTRFSDQGFRRVPVPMLFAGGVMIVILLLSADRFAQVFGFVVRNLIAGTGAGGIEGRAGALEALDVNLPLLYLKIGLKNVILSVGIVIALAFWWRYRRTDQVPLLLIATAPIFGFVVIFGAVGMFNQLVRYIAVVAVLGTIVAVIGFLNYLEPSKRQSLRSVLLVVLLCVGLVGAVPVIHVDPYSERPTHHVPESHYTAFETKFDHTSSDAQYLRIRSAPYRYFTAIHGSEAEIEASLDQFLPPVPDHFEGLDEEYDSQYYLPVTERDVRADAELYHGFRYSHADFARLDHDPEKVRLYDNDGVVFYTNSES